MNKAILIGNLGADPELRFTQGGQAVLNLRLATTESYLDKDGKRQERTDWHNVVVWGKRGEALDKILSKGSRVGVEGRIQTSSYDDKDGNKRYRTDVVASNVLLLDGKAGGGRRDDEDDRGRGRDRDDRGQGRDGDRRDARGRDDRERGRDDDRGRRDERPRDDRRERARDDDRGSKSRREPGDDRGDDDIPF